MSKVGFKKLGIEITRRCNLTCSHCIRGSAEALDINPEYIANVFKQTDFIDTLYISGGEPLLVPDLLITLADLIKTETSVRYIFMYSNATLVSDNILTALDTLNHTTKFKVSYSADRFHPKPNPTVIEALSSVCKVKIAWENCTEKHMKAIGSASKLPLAKPKHSISFNWTNNLFNSGMYLNVLGNLVISGDLSYTLQNEPSLIFAAHSDSLYEKLTTQGQRYKDANLSIFRGKLITNNKEKELAWTTGKL